MDNPDIRLTRTSEQDGKQTVGTIVVPQTSFHCMSLELPWKSNQNNVSCIPPAPTETKVYEWERLESSPSFDYPHIYIKDVPSRSFVKIHSGNFHTQILGCILVGDDLTDINSDDLSDTTNSKETLEKLLDEVGQSGTIEIINQVGYY